MKPTITKMKGVRGRVVGYRAKYDGIELEGQGPTPREAAEALDGAVAPALRRLERGGWLGKAWGHVYAVWPSTTGWTYSLDTFQPGYTVNLPGGEPFEAACDHALIHLGQNVWTPTADDRAFLDAPGVSCEARRQLAGWLGFQRAWLAAPEGTSDKHRWACEHAKDHAPPVEEGATIPAPAIH